MSRRAFTLIELLIVIGVIALLIGVLLPALSSARAAGRATVCSSAARQLQLANDLYATDHDDRCMPGAVAIATTNLHRWHGVRASPGEPFAPHGAPITPYLDDDRASSALRACPDFAHVLGGDRERSAGFESGNGGYGYNFAFVGVVRTQTYPDVWEVTDDSTGSRRSVFSAPALTVAFADSALAADDVIEYSFIEPPYWPQFPGWRPDPSAHFRHRGRASIAHLDGHVAAEAMSHTEASGLYSGDPREAGIGWFGDAHSNSLFDYR